MKKIHYILILSGILSLTACNEWLNILPDNEQVTDDYWKSKEDVEAVLASGYYYMRNSVPDMIRWGELRGGTLYSSNTSDAPLQNFNMTATSSLCDYDNFYKTINMANSVIKYAPQVRLEDDTYYESVMNSHLVEAYFMRAFCYFQLLKNYREVPLVLQAYVNDDASYEIAKSSDTVIIAQIKKDITTALATGAAKEQYEESWQTKGRVTKWALYALMADVCLWDEDYDNCIIYANDILNATANFRPVFIKDPAKWFDIFYPGNSNESIMELNWNYQTYNEKNNFGSYFTLDAGSRFKFTDVALELFKAETNEVKANDPTVDGRYGRTLMASYVHSGATITDYKTANQYYVWKYKGTDVADRENIRTAEDANFILYRVAEVMLMKAEALVMKGEPSWNAALDLVNTVRKRAAIDSLMVTSSETNELDMLKLIMHERQMEFVAEGKRWYDLLRFGKLQNFKYKEQFIDMVVEANQTMNPQWIRSVLKSNDALYMPLPQSEIIANPLLVQNPYYSTTK
ncbi:MAG TPA: RagB/SusD family nutrient uptake outer membrane protein [Bacteroidales bacterium]|nr:RagB/SusD family nutrient uptake outer membrane protein [Bacteroidales bacterium]